MISHDCFIIFHDFWRCFHHVYIILHHFNIILYYFSKKRKLKIFAKVPKIRGFQDPKIFWLCIIADFILRWVDGLFWVDGASINPVWWIVKNTKKNIRKIILLIIMSKQPKEKYNFWVWWSPNTHHGIWIGGIDGLVESVYWGGPGGLCPPGGLVDWWNRWIGGSVDLEGPYLMITNS